MVSSGVKTDANVSMLGSRITSRRAVRPLCNALNHLFCHIFCLHAPAVVSHPRVALSCGLCCAHIHSVQFSSVVQVLCSCLKQMNLTLRGVQTLDKVAVRICHAGCAGANDRDMFIDTNYDLKVRLSSPHLHSPDVASKCSRPRELKPHSAPKSSP